jgi:outer membrane protein assembly factor BamB
MVLAMPPLERLIQIVIVSLVCQLILLPGASAVQAATVPTADAFAWNRMIAETSPAPTFTASSSGRMALGQHTLWFRPETLFGAEPVLQALAPESGELKRSFKISPNDEISAAVGDTCLVRDELGLIQAYVTHDSRLIWSYSATIIDAILGADTKVLVGVGTAQIRGLDTRVVVAINADTGGEVWRSELPYDPIESSQGSIKGFVAGGVAVVWITGEGTVSVLNVETGDVNWTAEHAGLVPGAAPMRNGLVYVIDKDRTVHARDALTGHIRWSFPMRTVTYASAVQTIFDAGEVVVGAYATPTSLLEMDKGMFFRFIAVDAATGSLRWEYPADSDWLQGKATFSADVLTVYASVETGRTDTSILALDKATGEPLWRSSQLEPYRPITVSEGKLILATRDGWPAVLVLDAANGSSAWQEGLPSIGASEVSDLFVSDGLVYAHAYQMNVLRLSDGSRKWSAGPIATYKTEPLAGDWIEGMVSAIAVVLTIAGVTALFFGVRWIFRFGRRPVHPGIPPSH